MMSRAAEEFRRVREQAIAVSAMVIVAASVTPDPCPDPLQGVHDRGLGQSMGALRRSLLAGFLLTASSACALLLLPDDTLFRAEEVVECDGIRAGKNTFTSYGLNVTDCFGAQELLQDIVDRGASLSVYAGGCVLKGEGEDAVFSGGCDWEQEDHEGALPEAVGDGFLPVRDSQGRISAIIDVKGKGGERLYLTLIRAGVVELSDECKVAKARPRRHQCVRLREAFRRYERGD